MVILFRKARSATDTAEALYSAYVRNYCYQAIAQVFAVYSPFSDKKGSDTGDPLRKDGMRDQVWLSQL